MEYIASLQQKQFTKEALKYIVFHYFGLLWYTKHKQLTVSTIKVSAKGCITGSMQIHICTTALLYSYQECFEKLCTDRVAD